MPKKRVGRPTKYTPRLVDRICARLAMGESLRSVCRDEKMPNITTIFEWLRKYEDFSNQYARAKQESADYMAEELLDIADNGANDYMERENKLGDKVTVVDKEHIMRSRLRVDTRKWLMSKMKPKKYGDKLDVTSDGKVLPTPILGGLSREKDK